MADQAPTGASLQEDGATMLVPFTYNNPFWDGLQASERSYDVAGFTVTLHQNWKPDGKGGSKLGFGASVYDAAFVLSHFLTVMQPGLLPGATVVDIGTGLGLSSLACALANARTVIATDGDSDLLDGCSLPNIQHNISTLPQLASWTAHSLCSTTEGLAPPHQPRPSTAAATDTEAAAPQPAQTLHVTPLLWGDRDHEQRVLQCLGGAFPDFIVAADIVAAPYEEALPLLAESLHRLMGLHTVAYIAHKPRHVCEERWFRRLGKAFTVVPLSRKESIHPDFQSNSTIRIVKIQKRPARAPQGDCAAVAPPAGKHESLQHSAAAKED